MLALSLYTGVAFAEDQDSIKPFYSDNDVIYYDKYASDPCTTGGASTAATPIGGPLPAETLQRIKATGFDAMLAKTKERYLYAEKETGVPWQMLAAIHYREAGMNPRMSMAAGEPLRDGKSMDGIQMSSDPNKDASLAAKHVIEMAQMVYKVDPRKDRSLETLANTFLAYNRGFLYVRAKATYNTSPYVMNGFDAQHLNMSWGPGDTVSGRDANLGALTIYSYLTGQGANATGPTDNSGCSSGAVASAECSATTPVTGAEGNKHQLTRDELTALYGPPSSQSKTGNLASVDFLGKKLQIHKKLVGCFNAVVNEIKTKNIQYNVTDIGGWRQEVGGGSVSNGSSYHQYGAAIDINPDQNPCCSVARYTMPQGYIDAFKNHGWSWGGNWNSIKDYMHFEYNGPPL